MEKDRIFIADSLRAGWSLRKIAAELGRPASTISREVRRNSHPRSGDYCPYAAHDRAMARLPRPKAGKIAQNPELRDYIQRKLEIRWSPEQIVHSLKRDFPDRPEVRVPTKRSTSPSTSRDGVNCAGRPTSRLRLASRATAPHGDDQ